jgi:transposase InsO family protein
LGVSVSAYYQRRSGRRSPKAIEDERLPRCRVQRLMRAHGIVGAKRRGKPWRTTRSDPQAARRPDLVQRNFSATRPNELWVADISYLRSSVVSHARARGGDAVALVRTRRTPSARNSGG